MRTALFVAALLPTAAFAQHLPQPRETFAAEDIEDYASSDRDWNDVVLQWRGVCDQDGSGDIVRHRFVFAAAASGARLSNGLTLRLPAGAGTVTLDGAPVTPADGVVTLLSPFAAGFVGSPGGFVNTDGDWSAEGTPHVVQIDFPTPRSLGLGCPLPAFEVVRPDLTRPIGDLTTYQGANEPMAARLDGFFRPPREGVAVSDAYVGSPSFTEWAADIADLSCDTTCGDPQWWEQPSLGAVDARDAAAMESLVPLPDLPLCTDGVQNGDETGPDCGDPLGVCGACSNAVPLFVGVSEDVRIIDNGTYADDVPWIFSLEGFDGVDGTFAALEVKPTSGGAAIQVATDVLVTSNTFEGVPVDRVAYAVKGAVPGTMDVYVADAPSWGSVLVASGLTVGTLDGRRDLQFLDRGLLAIFSDMSGYLGTLDLAFTTAGGGWVTQRIDPGNYPPGHPEEGNDIQIGAVGLLYANGTLAFLADYEHVACGAGVAGVASRSGDTWTVQAEIDGQYGTLNNIGLVKVCNSWRLSLDGTRLAYSLAPAGGFVGYATKVAAAPSWAPTALTMPPPYDASLRIFPMAFVDGGARLMVQTESPAQGLGVVSMADLNDVTMFGAFNGYVATPDFGAVVFVDPSANYQVVSGAGGWAPTPLTSDGSATSFYMEISANGATVAFMKDDGTLHVASAPGWAATQLDTGISYDSSIFVDPSGRVVLYSTGVDSNGDGVCHSALSAEGWVPRTIDACNLWAGPWPPLSSDGSAFVYSKNLDPDVWEGDMWWGSTVTGATADLGMRAGYGVWASNTGIVAFRYPGPTQDSYAVPLPAGAPVP